MLEDLNWLYADSDDILITIFSTIIIYVVIILITRLNGLRTFAKMSSFDFAITIAIGSVIASTMLLHKESVVQGAVGLAILVLLQFIVAKTRKSSNVFDKLITNQPILLMDKGVIIHKNLKATRVTEADLYAKLREANVLNKDQVLAVVLETTGDMSVLHSNDTDKELDEEMLKGVHLTPP
ncbi:DUF421 domain-containing protein [Fulvivirga maritima]|uniref:DUF421 domain-containing protein n=1 Tax=Fulvivirga maritima TaxID=2904247 RepID=UPI001F210FEB|nr:YetF domain-containing protein [Fulvivirga maritima]UII25790.1 DUF421 domain-containing protein [Fulvivirga maritima]